MAAGANGCDATRSCGSRRTGGGVECAVAGLVTRLASVRLGLRFPRRSPLAAASLAGRHGGRALGQVRGTLCLSPGPCYFPYGPLVGGLVGGGPDVFLYFLVQAFVSEQHFFLLLLLKV
jgi:hypothetical protein